MPNEEKLLPDDLLQVGASSAVWQSVFEAARHLNRFRFLWACRFILPNRVDFLDRLASSRRAIEKCFRVFTLINERAAIEESWARVVENLESCNTEEFETDFWPEHCAPLFDPDGLQYSDENRREINNQVESFLETLSAWICRARSHFTPMQEALFELGAAVDQLVRPRELNAVVDAIERIWSGTPIIGGWSRQPSPPQTIFLQSAREFRITTLLEDGIFLQGTLAELRNPAGRNVTTYSFDQIDRLADDERNRLLRMYPDWDVQARYIDDSLNRVSNRLNDLLELSGIKSGRAPLTAADFLTQSPRQLVDYSLREIKTTYLAYTTRYPSAAGQPQVRQDPEKSVNVNSSEKSQRPVSTIKTKRSTQNGEARIKIIAALAMCHEYDGESCLRTNPVGNNELARRARAAESTVSKFFKDEFGGRDGYLRACQDVSKLIASLRVLNNELRPRNFLGRLSGGEVDSSDAD